MRKITIGLMAGLLLAGTAWAVAKPDQPKFHAKLKDQVLYVMLSQAGSYVLPHLYIFDGSGMAIYHMIGYDQRFDHLIDSAIKSGHSTSVPQPFSLDTFLGWVDFDAGSHDLQKLRSQQGVMTIVEFSAPWCEDCRLEQHALAAYLSDHPELKVRWLDVNADPETMDPALRKQAEQEHYANIRKQKGGT